jgi:hypothetical protein
MKTLKAFLKFLRCWLGFHPIDENNRGYVGFYWCPRCKKYVEL